MGIFLASRSLVAMMYGFSSFCMFLACLRKSAKTLASLPNTPLLIQSSTDCPFPLLSWEGVNAEKARSTPTNFAKLVQLPTPPKERASIPAPMIRLVPFSNLEGL